MGFPAVVIFEDLHTNFGVREAWRAGQGAMALLPAEANVIPHALMPCWLPELKMPCFVVPREKTAAYMG